MPVARRLALLLFIPLAATLVFAAWGVASTSRQALDADRLQSLVAVSASAGEAIHQLGRERELAARLVSDPQAGLNAYLEQVTGSDRAVDAYRRHRDRVDSAGLRELVGPFDEQLRLLPALREQVRARSTSLTAVLVRYRVSISQGLTVRESVGQVGGAGGAVADQLRVAAALSRAAEYAAIQQVSVATGNGVVLTPAVQAELAATRAGYDEALLAVTQRSSARWRSWLDQALIGSQVLAAQRFDDSVARTQVGQRLRVHARAWTAATSERRDRLHEVQTRVDGDIAAKVGRQRTEQWVTTGVLSGTAVSLVAAAAALTWRQGRALARRLRRVRDAVTRVAERDLPDLVRRVDAADPADPASVPPPAAALASGSARDEVDEVAAAFDSLALNTYRISTDLARQRRVAAGAVEAVGRRCQGMTHRLLRELDMAERDEKDAATLATFFAVDSLAAQLLHATQSLLVLSGRSLGAVHPQPAELVTVAQAAQGRIQEYRRVRLGVIDERVLVPPPMIDDLVHLLASLLDNATRYSPGDALVTGHLLGNRAIIQVTDTGPGIKPDLLARLNAELAEPAPMIEVEHIRRQGLATVALLAAAHGLRVRLLPGQPHGTVAEVEIPADKLLISIPEPAALPPGPIAGRRAPGGTPASTLTLPAPTAVPARRGGSAALPARRRPPAPSTTDGPTQALPVIPVPRRATEPESTPAYDETARHLPPPAWFVEGATVHMPSTPARGLPGQDTTTANGLPKRQPKATFTPPPPPAADAPVRSMGGLASTAGAYQRGLDRRFPQSKGQS
ncbi:histidine kinase/DNA gyrase B/HSP90-like ATPase [Micromonospora sp. M71_S20]|uniref:nitrate- and nitrite sensing domain-containing protein n=1 Tax=Micromonospora sp. M71_S20 TaxID=592872 RepID=UPI000EB20CC5|nr:nitrate- and nitrite sensing domain-containing protein [Micromonospora sp. M71_S20]RLK23791.1 histidine kinase/DNA gyrase B/HSP90-like ATPase [Micromonospora sp. M71_S20]